MKQCSHGDAIDTRRQKRKSSEIEAIAHITKHYGEWINNRPVVIANNEQSIKQLVDSTNEYLSSWDTGVAHIIKNNGQCKVYSSIFEEFFTCLFKDIIGRDMVCGSGRVLVSILYNPDYIAGSSSVETCVEVIDADFCIGHPTSIGKDDLVLPLVILEQKKYADKNMRARHEFECQTYQRFNKKVMYGLVIYQLANSFSGPINKKKYSFTTYMIKKDDHINEINENTVHKIMSDVNETIDASKIVVTRDLIAERGWFV